MNSVNIIGNMTRDPEVRHTSAGMPLVTFGIAYNGKRKNASGEWVDQPHFFDVTAWGERFEKVAAYLSKGKKIGVSGRLEYQTWEQDGVKRSKVQIVANDITFASSKSDGDSGPVAREPQPDGYTPANMPDDDDIPF